MTVNTPTTAETTATTPPIATAMWTGALAKKPGSNTAGVELVHGRSAAPEAGPAGQAPASAARPAPATTRTRPCTRSTSTWWPYSRLRTSARTTSSVGPLAARPPAR